MTHRKIIAYSRLLFLASILFWIAETAYFGWNAHAMSPEEKLCDSLVNIGIITALLARVEVCCDLVITYLMPKEQ